MSRRNTSEDTHGKNSIEAAADTTMDALHAVKDNLEKGELSGSNGKAAKETKEFLRTVSESASDVAGTAANALGANIPEANKAEPVSQQKNPAQSKTGPSQGSRSAKAPSKTAQDYVDEANNAISALEGQAKAGIEQGRRSLDDAAKRAGASARGVASGVKRDLDSASASARKEAESLHQKGQDLGHEGANSASRLGSAMRDTVEKAKEQTEHAAHNLFPHFGGQKGTADPHSTRPASGGSNGSGHQPWQRAARDEADKAENSAQHAYHRAKDTAHSVTDAVASTYHDVKETAKATVEDIEDSAKSALDRLRERLDADMVPHNFVDERLSVGLIPSNTEEVLASRAIAIRG